jgi:hypothetical protein
MAVRCCTDAELNDGVWILSNTQQIIKQSSYLKRLSFFRLHWEECNENDNASAPAAQALPFPLSIFSALLALGLNPRIDWQGGYSNRSPM